MTVLLHRPPAPADPDALPSRHRFTASGAAWAALLLASAFPLLGALADLMADRHGIPADHRAAFRTLTGTTVAQATKDAPGLVRYVHQLEIGYAVHEFVFALLLVAIVAVPLRRRQPWAWWASWSVLIADFAYAATFGRYDAALLRQAVLGGAAVAVTLAVVAPSTLRQRKPAVPTIW